MELLVGLAVLAAVVVVVVTIFIFIGLVTSIVLGNKLDWSNIWVNGGFGLLILSTVAAISYLATEIGTEILHG